jgi:sialic acid synthase SpsE
MYGSDQAASLEERGLKELLEILKKIPGTYGSADKTIFDLEKEVAKKLRYWESNL